MKPQAPPVWFVPLVLLGMTAYALAEDLTLTTYYPSPRGVYKELRATDSVAIGATRGPWQPGSSPLPAHRLLVAGQGVNRVDSLTCPAGTDWYNEDSSGFVDDGECKPTVLVTPTGQVGIGTTSPVAALEVTSTASGFLPPRLTTDQRQAVASPAEGMVIYNITTHALNVYNGSTWTLPTQAGGGGNQVFNGTQDFVIPDGVTQVTVECWGGGGGGGPAGINGGGPPPGRGGGGGGGGGYAKATLSVTPLGTYQVIVGAKGTAATSGCPGSGGPSSESAFVGAGVILIRAQGGGNGGTSGGPACNTSFPGLAGGGGSGQAPITVTGESGGSAGLDDCPAGVDSGGHGGSSPNGGTATIRQCDPNSSGPPGNAPGGGGGGSALGSGSIYTGGDGANGRVVISW